MCIAEVNVNKTVSIEINLANIYNLKLFPETLFHQPSLLPNCSFCLENLLAVPYVDV